jgi:hypothetical protein
MIIILICRCTLLFVFAVFANEHKIPLLIMQTVVGCVKIISVREVILKVKIASRYSFPVYGFSRAHILIYTNPVWINIGLCVVQ